MQNTDIEGIAAWLVEAGLTGMRESDVLQGFCDRCCTAGLPLSRGLVIIDTLHPSYEGRAFRWRNDGVAELAEIEYGRTSEGEAAANWRRSIFFHLLENDLSELRFALRDAFPDFPQLDTLRDEGHTEVVTLIHRFRDGAFGEMDCVYSQWCSRKAGGLEDADLAKLRRLAPTLALALKSISLARVTATLMEVYLGRDAGRRVLEGRILRGVAERIEAVLWFSDLRGYTAISDRIAPDEIIPLLNDYADAVISAIHDAGGDVLKLIGDGILAIFNGDTAGEACHRALVAQRKMRRRVAEVSDARVSRGQATSAVYLGMHLGEVFYGNIGSQGRLDFTVVGPAVNEVSRIAALCRSVDRLVLVSSTFMESARPEDRSDFVSVGRYALRGVGQARDLYTLDSVDQPPLP